MSIVEMMGIKDHDPLVLAAVSEYARSFAMDILCDAKDYASHAGRHEVTSADVSLALKLKDSNVSGLRESAAKVNETRAIINEKPLPVIPETFTFSWPKDNLLTQQYTYTSTANVNDAVDVGDAEMETVERESVWRRESSRGDVPKIDINEDAIKRARVG